MDRLRVIEPGGRVLQDLDQADVVAAHGHPIRGVSRSALHEGLAHGLPADRLHFGRRATKIEHHFDGVSVFFDDGTEVDADVIIGADGAKSRVRAALFPDAALRSAGQTCLRGIAKGLPGGDWNTAWTEIWGDGRRFGCVRVGENETYWSRLSRPSRARASLSAAPPCSPRTAPSTRAFSSSSRTRPNSASTKSTSPTCRPWRAGRADASS